MAAAAVTMLVLAGAVVALASSRSDATTVPSMGERFSVLQPATDQALAELPEEAREAAPALRDFGGPSGPPSEFGVAKTASGTEVLVLGGEDTICAYDLEHETSNCAASGLVVSGQVFTAVPDLEASPDGCGDWRVLGLMPDGVDSLKVDAPGEDAPSSIPVTSNVYLADLPPAATTLSDGSISVDLPLDKFASGNTSC